jgi:hypothetical protein
MDFPTKACPAQWLVMDNLWSFNLESRLESYVRQLRNLVRSQNVQLGREFGSKRRHATTDTDIR